MQTWIDQYISDLGGMMTNDQPHTVFDNEVALAAGSGYDKYIDKTFKKIPNFVLGKAMLTLGVRARAIDDGDLPDGYLPFAKLDKLVFSFCYPTDFSTNAIKLNVDLAKTFAGVKAPSISHSELELENSVCYIDVPPRTILIGKEYLRALFLVTETANTKVACVLDTENSDGDIMITFEFGDYLSEFERNDCIDHKTASVMQEKIEHFITLSLLYHKIAAEEHKQLIPRINIQTAAKLSAKKASSKHQKTSLFNVHYLKAPKGHFGMRLHQREYTMSGSWDVRGHFRWQACGIGKQKRKLIWIEGYVKGSGEKNQRIDVLT